MEEFVMNKLKLYTDDDYRENVLKSLDYNINQIKEVNKNGRNR